MVKKFTIKKNCVSLQLLELAYLLVNTIIDNNYRILNNSKIKIDIKCCKESMYHLKMLKILFYVLQQNNKSLDVRKFSINKPFQKLDIILTVHK